MPKVKERSAITKKNLEERYAMALKGLDDGTYQTLRQAAEACDVRKSSLGHRRNGRRPRQEAHQGEQIFSPAAEKAIVRWLERLDELGFPARIDHLMGLVVEMAKDPKNRQVQMQKDQKNVIGKNWITRFLNRHDYLAAKFASRLDKQRALASDPHTIQTHFRRLAKLMRDEKFEPNAISNVDEKGFVMGVAKRTKVITKRGKKNPRSKQDGKREFITALETVSADGFVFPSFLIAKGAVQCFDWYKNVHADDGDARFAVSQKGWTDNKMAMHWLTKVYDPVSKARCPGKQRLLILDGHVSHVNYTFLGYCEQNGITVFCLPAHSTHLLQPLDVGLFSQLQTHYQKAVEDYFRITSVGINRDTFFPLYKRARAKAYTLENITSAFECTGIVPLNARVVLSKLDNPTAISRAAARDRMMSDNSFPLDRTPYTKFELRQQTNQALYFVKKASEGEICNLILRFSHSAEYALVQTDIANHQMRQLRESMRNVRVSKKDMRQFSKEKRSGVLTATEIVEEIKQREDEVAAKEARKQARTAAAAEKKQAAAQKTADKAAAAAKMGKGRRSRVTVRFEGLPATTPDPAIPQTRYQ
jgi:hypothetical protein